MQRFRLTKQQRLKQSAEFRRVFDQQERGGDRNLLLFGARNDLGITRFGVSVSKKHGNAVRRGRLKRLLREAFRLSQHDLPPGLDLILIPKQGTDPTLEDFRQGLRRGVQQLSRRLLVDREAPS